MKKIALLLLTLAVWLTAAPVNRETAKTAAQNYFLHNAQNNRNAQISRVISNDYQGKTASYTFIFEDKGFVIVSADNLIRPVLGFSDESSFDPAEMPASVKWWLNSYAEQLAFGTAKNLKSSTFAAEWQQILDPAYARTTSAKSGFYLVKSKWNQRPLYNNYCPKDSGHLSVVGCVATASSQIMKYWNYPERGTGTHTYNCNTTFPKVTLTNNYDSLINWKIIPHKLSDDMSPEAIKETAKLCYKAGVALNMSYSYKGSGTQAGYIAEMLKNHYKYSATTQDIDRYDYTDDAWTNLVKAELNAGRPLEYSGMELFSGHSFICDGYNGENLFHINWGWGGSFDGYFALNALDVATYSFNYSQGAVIGIQPPVLNGLTCTITQPVAGSVFDLGQNITVTAAVSATSTAISRVEFYLDNQLIGSDEAFPYEYKLATASLSAGGHSLRAAAYASDGSLKDFTTGFRLKNAGDLTLISENFDAGSLPGGWIRRIKNNSYYWDFTNFSMNDYVHHNPTSSSSVICKGSNYTSDEFMIAPQIDLTNYNNARVDFAVLYSRKALNTCSLFVKVTDNLNLSSAKWTKIWSAQSDADTASAWQWHNRSLDLSTYAGKKIWISWNYKGTKGDGVAIDDIFVVNSQNAAGLPVISVENPADNQLVLMGEPLNIKATAADNGSVNKMEFFVNGSKVYETAGAVLDYSWNTSTLAKGSYNLKIVAIDNESKISNREFKVQLTDGAPLVKFGAPLNGTRICKGSQLNLQAAVSSPYSSSPITDVKFYLDTELIGSGTLSQDFYNINLNTVNLTLCPHVVRVEATNQLGQKTEDAIIINIYKELSFESFTDSIPAHWNNVVNAGNPAGEPGQVWKFKHTPSTLNPSGRTDGDNMWIYSYNYGTTYKQNTTVTTSGINISSEIDTVSISLDECFEYKIGGGSSSRIRFSTDSLNWQTLRFDSLNNVYGTTYRSMKQNSFLKPVASNSKIYLSFTYIGTSFTFWLIDNLRVTGWSGPSGVEEVKPQSKELSSFNYPNPFNNSTLISYQLPVAEQVRLAVYNSRGELVKELVNAPQQAGHHQVSFNGAGLASGLYFYRLQTAGHSVMNRMLLIK